MVANDPHHVKCSLYFLTQTHFCYESTDILGPI